MIQTSPPKLNLASGLSTSILSRELSKEIKVGDGVALNQLSFGRESNGHTFMGSDSKLRKSDFVQISEQHIVE